MFERTLKLTVGSSITHETGKKCETVGPKTKNAHLDPDCSLVQGLRPLRHGNVRVGREPRMKDSMPSRIVHAYKHGIGGLYLAFGSPSELV